MAALDRRLIERARPVRALLAFDVALGLCAALLVLVQAVALARVAARGFEGASLNGVAVPLAVLVVAGLARGAASWGFEVAGRRAAHSVLSGLRLDLARRRLRCPRGDDGAAAAEIATAAVDGVDGLAGAFGRYLPQLVLAVIVPVAVLVTVAVIDPISAAIMLLTLPLVPVFMWLVGRHTERRTRERWQTLALLAGHFLDVVRGLPTLRAFNRGEAQSERIEEVAAAYRRATMGTLRVAFLSGAVLELAATLGVALVAVTVGVRLVEGGLGLEAGLTVLVLAPELYAPLRGLAAQWHASADGLAVTSRMLDLLEDGDELDTERGTEAPSPADAPVRFECVTVNYPGRTTPALDELELELAPGSVVALVGKSGSGKTTAVSLLLGLVRPDQGRISVGGIDLAGCDLGAWWRRIAWSPEHPMLFCGTIADNIRLGAPSASTAEVLAAVAGAGAGDFVSALPDGLATVVGDGGRALSAGETRRIGLARAFVRRAPLLVLDEPTADLDAVASAAVADTLSRLRGTCTTLLVTHDLALAGVADTVVELARGRVAASRLLEAAR